MHTPGFSAEAVLYPRGTPYWLRNEHGRRLVDTVVPAKPVDGFTMCGHDPNDYCTYTCFTLHIHDSDPWFSSTVSTSHVCGHK
jgi:hypothetical protein